MFMRNKHNAQYTREFITLIQNKKIHMEGYSIRILDLQEQITQHCPNKKLGCSLYCRVTIASEGRFNEGQTAAGNIQCVKVTITRK